jgi:serine/threonine-protein kinase TNNI3K
MASILALFVGLFWRHRKLQKKRLGELVIEHASLEKQQRHQAATAVWTDTVLLQNRLDDDLIERNRLLGSGAFTEVWLVTYKNEHYALKQVQQDASTIGDRDRINAFVEEIKLLSSLSHVGILSVVGVVWTKESDIAMVTEYMAEGDLRAYLDRTPTIQGGGWTRPMVQVALQITETIVYLHSLEPAVIHRDLTSRTVLLDSTMRVKLSDVGIARRKLDGERMAQGVGKERWVAPEVLAGEEAGESGDIYSLGVILSEIDTHKQPFEAAMTAKGLQLSDAALASLLMSGSLHLHLSDACPAEIRSLVERCTAFDPNERPNGLQVAYELRQMLKSSVSWVKKRGVYHSTLLEEERIARDTIRLTST